MNTALLTNYSSIRTIQILIVGKKENVTFSCNLQPLGTGNLKL